MFGVKNIMIIVLVSFGTKSINFGNILTQEYQTYLPAVCARAECHPWQKTLGKGKVGKGKA